MGGLIEIATVDFSSEAADFPASNLRIFDEEGKGWLSFPDVSGSVVTTFLPCQCTLILYIFLHTMPSFCVRPSQGGFPQSLTLNLPSRCHVETLDILSDQAKIAESVEIYLGDGTSETIDYDDDVFNLGYITFDQNDQSDYQVKTCADTCTSANFAHGHVAQGARAEVRPHWADVPIPPPRLSRLPRQQHAQPSKPSRDRWSPSVGRRDQCRQ